MSLHAATGGDEGDELGLEDPGGGGDGAAAARGPHPLLLRLADAGNEALFVGGVAIGAGEEDPDPPDDGVTHAIAIGVAIQADSTGEGGDATGGGIGEQARILIGPVRFGSEQPLALGNEGGVHVEAVDFAAQGVGEGAELDVVGGPLDAIGPRGDVAVAVGVFDVEQVDGRGVHDARREVPADANRGDEARSTSGRGGRRRGAAVVGVGVPLDLAFGDG